MKSFKVIKCANCGVNQVLSIPISFGNKRGFKAPLHECGEQYRSYTYSSTCPRENAFFVKVFEVLVERSK